MRQRRGEDNAEAQRAQRSEEKGGEKSEEEGGEKSEEEGGEGKAAGLRPGLQCAEMVAGPGDRKNR